MVEPAIIELAKSIARAHGVDPPAFCGLVERESGWDNYKIRFEPGFLKEYIVPLEDRGELNDATEIQARAFSWGPCQVMGEEARERGYTGHLAKLCEWQTGLDIGALALAHEISIRHGDLTQGLLAYNGGSNPNYAEEVLALARKYA